MFGALAVLMSSLRRLAADLLENLVLVECTVVMARL